LPVISGAVVVSRNGLDDYIGQAPEPEYVGTEFGMSHPELFPFQLKEDIFVTTRLAQHGLI
jgi:hypothetical protein